MNTNLYRILMDENPVDNTPTNEESYDNVSLFSVSLLTATGIYYGGRLLFNIIDMIKAERVKRAYINGVNDENFFAQVFADRTRWDEAIHYCPRYQDKIASKLIASPAVLQTYLTTPLETFKLLTALPTYASQLIDAMFANEQIIATLNLYQSGLWWLLENPALQSHHNQIANLCVTRPVVLEKLLQWDREKREGRQPFILRFPEAVDLRLQEVARWQAEQNAAKLVAPGASRFSA